MARTHESRRPAGMGPRPRTRSAAQHQSVMDNNPRRAMTNYLERTLLTDGRTHFPTDDEMALAANACTNCGTQLAADNPYETCDIRCKRQAKRKGVRMNHDAQHPKHPGVYRPDCHGC